jgi:hypothetical protein
MIEIRIIDVANYGQTNQTDLKNARVRGKILVAPMMVIVINGNTKILAQSSALLINATQPTAPVD